METFYERVTNPDEIKAIEYRSEYWKPHSIEDTDKYIIMKQWTANGNKSTGYVKIVEKSRAEVHGIFDRIVEADASDWMYFKKRRNNG